MRNPLVSDHSTCSSACAAVKVLFDTEVHPQEIRRPWGKYFAVLSLLSSLLCIINTPTVVTNNGFGTMCHFY